MEPTARLFHCLRCHCQVRICRACDRGNIYCGSVCSASARKNSMHAAGARYQKSFQGKLKHAARQKRYRERQQQKVTHHGSKPERVAPLSIHSEQCTVSDLTALSSLWHCDFCGCSISDVLRIYFLDRSTPNRVVIKMHRAQGP